MTSPRDPIDDWLARDVAPLGPPPGALDRIRHRARRRKLRQATVAAAGCAVIVAAAVVTPALVSHGQHSGHGPPLASQTSPPTVQPSQNGSNAPTPDSNRATQLQQRTTLGHSWTVPPANFQPTSVTFVGTGNNTVVGAVIGQAGSPGHCATSDCTSLAYTANYGGSWYGLSAPVAPGPAGGTGVSQLRFATMKDGWAFGPGLYETSQGGWPWQQEDTHGQRVVALEAVAARAFAVFASCTGSGPDYSAHCSRYSLWTSVPGSRTWTPVAVPAPFQSMASASAAPQLVIAGGTSGYLLTPSGDLLAGSVSGGPWRVAGHAPCAPAAAGSTSGAQFAAGPGALLLACDSTAPSVSPGTNQTSPGGTGGLTITLYSSATGSAWHQKQLAIVAGAPTSLASAAPGQAVLATTQGIEYSADGGTTWHLGRFAGPAPVGGFRYAGMTNQTQGVAVPVNPALGAIWVTSDGGQSWHPSAITG